MGENQSKELSKKEVSAEEIRRRRLAKLDHGQTQNETEERRVAPKDKNTTIPEPQNIEKKPSVQSQSPKKEIKEEKVQATSPIRTRSEKFFCPEDLRKHNLAKIEHEKVQREVNESSPKLQTIEDQKTQNINENPCSESQSPGKGIELEQISPQAQEIKLDFREVEITSYSTPTVTLDMDIKPQAMNVLPEEILNHPVYKEHGKEAYALHAYFEEVYQGTCEPFSLPKKPELTFYKDLEEKQFTMENFDDILLGLLEASQYFSAQQKVTFLLDVYERLGNVELSGFVSDIKRNEFRKNTLAYLKSYLETPTIFSDQIAVEDSEDIFDVKSPLCNTLYDYFTSNDRTGVVAELVENLEETSFSTIITPLFKRIVQNCREYRLEDLKELTSALSLLESLIFADKRIIEFFVSHPLYSLGNMQNKTAIQFQRLTIFGSCLSLTTLPNESPAHNAFWFQKKKSGLEKPDIILRDLRERIHGAVDCVHRIMEYMIKVDKKYKKSVVDWLYEVLELNDSKQMSHNMGAIVSTIGWFTNYLVLLLKFCQKPLEDLNKYPNWFTKIDVDYIAARRIFKDVSLLNGRGNNYLQKPEGEFSFLTELIYMTTHALVLQKSANEQFLTILKKLGQITKDQGIKSLAFKNAFITRLGYDVQLQDPYLQSHTLKLLTFDALFTIHAFDVPIKDIWDLERPFEATQLIKGEDFNARATIPVYWAENIEEYLLFYWHVNSSLLTKNQLNFEVLANFMLSIFSNPHWITNPHLKGKCINFLRTLLPTGDQSIIGKRNENFIWVFKQNPFYERYLVFGLVHFFVEAEKSGYYEKYNYRQSVAMILNYLLRAVFPCGKTSYVAECLERIEKENYEIYLRFIMLYLNDSIHLLDEVFKNLRDMKKFEDDYNRGDFASLAVEEREESQMYYEANMRGCQTFSIYLKTFYQMGAAITKVSPDFFMTDEIRDKFILNLNYILDGLNGESATSLKVKSIKLMEFDPKCLLETVVQIYLNFSDKEEFIKGVSHDERSFKIELFYKTAQIMDKYNIMGPQEMRRFQELIEKLEVKAQEKKQEDDFMAKITDIPDEFMDPIMEEVMRDPVLLPSSQMIVDRLTIIKHLLSDDTDPFNRSKLTKEMLEPQPDLKQKIEEFFAKKRKIIT